MNKYNLPIGGDLGSSHGTGRKMKEALTTLTSKPSQSSRTLRSILFAISLLVLSTSVFADISTQVDSFHDWKPLVDQKVYGESDLPLPAADHVFARVKSFTKYAEFQFRTVYQSNIQKFFEAVRGTQIYWVVGKGHQEVPEARLEDYQMYAREPNGLGDLSRERLELTAIEEVVFDENGKKTGKVIKNFAVKYAPPEDEFSEEQIGDFGIRVVFYNVDAEFNRGLPRINPRAKHFAGIYHNRINVNAGGDGRNVLWMDMDKEKIAQAGFQGKESLIKDGKSNFKAAWNVFWGAKLVPATKQTLLTGLGSATVQAGISYAAFQHFGNPEAGFNVASGAITWIYVAVLSTFGKTYGNLVKNRDINYEVFMRSVIGVPLTLSLAVANHADLSNPYTLFSILMILVGDKFASAVYSFWPLAREERGLTAGKKSFGFVPQALMEREFTAWIRMALQQIAIAVAVASATNPHADFKHFGTLMVWFSAVPIYFFDLYMAKKHIAKSPKMDEEVKRLNTWVNPKTYVVNAFKEVKGVCSGLMSLLGVSPRVIPIKNPFSKK